MQSFENKSEGQKKSPMMIIGVVVVVIIIAAAVYYFTGDNNGDESDENVNLNTVTNEVTVSPEDKYRDEMGTIMLDEVYNGAVALSEFLTTNTNPAFWTAEDVDAVNDQTYIIENAYDKAVALDVPDKFATAHSLLLQGFKKYAEAMPIFREGLANVNIDTINESGVLLTEGADFINQASEELALLNENLNP